ncbi:hypothetical protein Tco_1213168 [Tanacetum coccineum]
MADHSQKWHDGSSSRNTDSSSNSEGITNIGSKLDSLDRDIKKLKEHVHAIQVGCQAYGGNGSPYITMEEYIQLMADKAQSRGQTFNWETATCGNVYCDDLDSFIDFETNFPAIIYNDTSTSNQNVSSEPTVSIYNAIKANIDFNISFSDSDDEGYTFICDKNLLYNKLIHVDDLKPKPVNDYAEINTESCSDNIIIKPLDMDYKSFKAHSDPVIKDLQLVSEPRGSRYLGLFKVFFGVDFMKKRCVEVSVLEGVISLNNDLSNIRPNLSTASRTIKTSRVNVNTARVNVNTGHGNVSSVSSAGTQIKSGSSRFNTGMQNVNSGSVHLNTARVNRPVLNQISNNISPKLSQGKMGTAVKTSAGCVWRKVIPLSYTNSGPTPDSNVNVSRGPQGRPKPGKAWVPKRN